MRARRPRHPTSTVHLLRFLEALDECPPYRFRVELSLARLQIAKLTHLELDALCLDLDRHFQRGDIGFLGPVLHAFARAWFLILHADAALRQGDLASAKRWIDGAALAAIDLPAVQRAALARLASIDA